MAFNSSGLRVVRKVQLTNSPLEAIVDDEDFELVSQYKWRATEIHGNFYAQRLIKRPAGRWTTQYMHTLIAGYAKTDHKNGNGLDNRRDNLRPVTNAQNIHNSKPPHTNTSGYKGVGWDKRAHRWRARIKVDGVRRTIGLFDDPGEAALAYDQVAREHWGEFAWLNFPDGK